MCGCFPTPPTGYRAHTPGMCPDWESDLWPFDSQASTQSNEPHQPGLDQPLYPQIYFPFPMMWLHKRLKSFWCVSLLFTGLLIFLDIAGMVRMRQEENQHAHVRRCLQMSWLHMSRQSRTRLTRWGKGCFFYQGKLGWRGSGGKGLVICSHPNPPQVPIPILRIPHFHNQCPNIHVRALVSLWIQTTF